MNILLTVLCGVALAGSIWAFLRAELHSDSAHASANRATLQATGVLAQRDRVTTLERECDALRRELRKLSGKFYAAQREVAPSEEHVQLRREANTGIAAPYCENYARSQSEGPLSEAAACPCNYCADRRAAKAAFREQQVPKTAAAQGDLARLNAGKP